ncbi:MAG: NAD-dependent epimerase/dehydratase family protein, partial [Solirubrobacteraceae bacterium]
VHVRPSFIWGPRGRERSAFSPLPALVHAAARGSSAGTGADPTARAPVHAGDGYDICYVKDCGHAIALVQTAPRLSHAVYNVGSGRVTTNAEVVAAIRAHVPDFDIELVEGRGESAPATDPVLDLARIRQETGYEPAYDTEAAVGDYLAWLHAGHDR